MKIRKSIAWMLVFGMTIGIFSGQTLYTPKADAAGDGDNVTAGWSTYSNYNMPDLTSIVDKSTEKDVKYYIDDRDILFSWSGNPDTSIDTFLWRNGKAILNQHTFRVVSKYNAPAFTFFLLKYLKPQFTHIASNKQTTGLGHVTVADLKRLQFCADENAIRDFNAITMPFFDMIFSNYKENQYLSSLRDTILPQLMSGELDVSEIDL